MKSTVILDKEILSLIDFYIKKIDGKINKTLSVDIKIKNTQSSLTKWIRLHIYAYSTYRVIAYTTCGQYLNLREVQVFAISTDHDSAWRSSILGNIIKNEQKISSHFMGYINNIQINEVTLEKNSNERLLFIETTKTKSLSIHI